MGASVGGQLGNQRRWRLLLWTTSTWSGPSRFVKFSPPSGEREQNGQLVRESPHFTALNLIGQLWGRATRRPEELWCSTFGKCN